VSDLIDQLRRDRSADPRVQGSPLMELRWKAADELEKVQDYRPYSDDQPLAGSNMPQLNTILDLIRYCTTIHSRFGNTCIESPSFQWGGLALNVRSDKQKRIDQLEIENKILCDTLEREGFDVDAMKTKALENLENYGFGCVVCGRPPGGIHMDCAQINEDGKKVIRFIPQDIENNG